MKSLIHRSEFTKHIITLVSGTGIAQLITLASTPILSRLFLPAEFASYTLFTAFFGVISVIAAGRFELAILLPKDEEESYDLVKLSSVIAIAVASITFIGILIYDLYFYKFWPTQQFNGWFYLLPPLILISGVYKAFNFLSTRQKTFKLNSISRVVTTLSLAIISILFGLFHFIPGLIIAFVVANLIGLLVLYFSRKIKSAKLFSGIKRDRLKNVFKKHAEFAKINVPHAVLDNLQEYGIIFFMAYYFSDALIGLYGFAFRILKAPLTLVGSAFYQVFYQRISQGSYTSKEVQNMVLRSYKNIFLIGFIPFTILLLFAPEIFAFVFGEEWRQAGIISQILTPWLFLNFILSPISCIPLIYKQQKGAFILTIIDVVCKYTLLIIAGMQNDYYLAFYMLSIFGSCLMIFGMWWYYHIPSTSMKKTE